MECFLVTYRPARAAMLTDGPTEHEQSKIGEHFRYLSELHRHGVLSFAGRTQDNGPETLGIAVVVLPDLAAARAMLAADPAVESGVFVGRVQPFAFAIGGLPGSQ